MMRRNARSFVSLYAGAGGLDCGFVEAGFRPLWANDFDDDAVETYRQNLGKHVTGGDIATARRQLKGVNPAIVIGGPPCQGFSVAGHLRPDDPRSRHVWTFLDIVEELQPQAFVMENVKSLAVNPRWTDLIDGLRKKAEALGFEARVWVLNASHFGVPQARERMFMVGIQGHVPTKPAAPTEGNPPTVREALRGHPALGEPGNDSICTALVTPARNPVLRPSPYAGLLFNGKGRALNLDAPAPTLPATMGGNRTPIIDQRQLEGKADENWVIGYHRRLTAGREPVRQVPKRMRRLTVEEAAVLQAFPIWWEFSGRQSSRFRQIGNAVPPVLAQAVAEQVDADLLAAERGMAAAKPAQAVAPLSAAA